MSNLSQMQNSADAGALKVLSLSLDGQLFAIEAGCVREILDLTPVTEVPASNAFASGLINVRGKVVPLADLRQKLGMAKRVPTIDTRIVVIEVDLDGDLTTVGMVADKVHEVTDIPPAAIEATPRIGLAWRHEFIRCLGKRSDDFLIVLDIARIFSSEEQTRHESSSFQGAEPALRLTSPH